MSQVSGDGAGSDSEAKKNIFYKIVSLYRPCKSDRHLTTYQQHIRWFSRQGKSVCPRKQILEDLHKQVDQWQSAGDMAIILMDINEDIWSESIASKQIQRMGLVKATTAIHGNNRPNMHNRGQTPIHGIFVHKALLNQLWQDIMPLAKVSQAITKLYGSYCFKPH